MVFQPEQPLLLRRNADALPVLAEIPLTLTAAQLFAWLP
jgi:hypothetical protein